MQQLTLGYSPCPNDTFIFYGLIHGHTPCPGVELTERLEDVETLNRLQRRKAVVFLLSDFLDEGYETPLRLAARKHDLIAFSIRDPLENAIPPVGLLHVRDAESGKSYWLDTGNRWVREHFAAEATERQSKLSQTLGRFGVDEIPLDITGDTISPLVRFFRQRMKRISRGGGKRAGALLLAGLLAWGGAQSAFAQNGQRPTIAPSQPPATQQTTPQPGLPPGMNNPGQQPGQMPPGMMPGGEEPPSLPFTPRGILDELDLPTLEQLTASARPRLEERFAKGISATFKLERDHQVIGERNALSWRIAIEKDAVLQPLSPDLGEPGQLQPLPPLTESGEIETALLERVAAGDEVALFDFFHADTLRGAEADTLSYRLDFTTFHPDTFNIPLQRVAYRLAGEDEDRILEFPAMELACISTLAASPDSAAMRDWKSPGELRGDWLPLLGKIGLPALFALALLVWLMVWWLRRRSGAFAEVPVIPPHVEAIEALDNLASEDLPGQGAFGSYYYQLSLIARRYLGRRFMLPFNDWTTEEIRYALGPPTPRLQLASTLSEPLIEDLSRADMVKFAKRTPSRDECDTSLKAARHLINATREIEAMATGDDLETKATSEDGEEEGST